MKKLIIILLLITSTAQAQVHNELMRSDRLLHASAGYVITASTTGVLYNFTDQDWIAEVVGLMIGISAGIAKEAWDYGQGRQPEFYDGLATGLGSVAATVTIRLTVHADRKGKYKTKIQWGR
jgi:VanZ family protein